MKKIKEVISFSINLILICMVGILFLNNETITEEKISTYKEDKYLPSRYLAYEEQLEIEVDDGIVEEEKIEEEKIEEIKEVKVETKTEIEEITSVKVEEPVEIEESVALETLVGKLSGYGPDCYGCTSNRTANGTYVGEGNIYYEDSVYGKVRILAGDKKYPFHTIVRITNSNISNEPIIGIVLDRGGAIGIGKKYLFDLLYTSEQEASVFGVSKDVTFEILRLGK